MKLYTPPNIMEGTGQLYSESKEMEHLPQGGCFFSAFLKQENRHPDIGKYISYFRTIKMGSAERKDSRDFIYGLYFT
ncbi:hypothetical protein D3C81_1567670 [compost metagenome]